MAAMWPSALSASALDALLCLADAAGFDTADELLLEALDLWSRHHGTRCSPCNSAAPRGSDDSAALTARGVEQAEEKGACWNSLPADVVSHVYARLRAFEGGVSLGRLVCRSWAAMLGACCTQLAPVRPTYGPRYVQKEFSRVFPHLRNLDLLKHPHFGRRPEDLNTLHNLTALASLQFKWWGELTGAQVACLNALPSLTSLHIVLKSFVSPDSLRALQALAVPCLALEWCLPDTGHVPVEEVRALHGIPPLKQLIVHASSGYFDESQPAVALYDQLTCLQPLTALHCLMLARRNASSAQLAGLQMLSDIQVLDLSECYSIHQASLTALRPLSNLRWLNLSAPGYEELNDHDMLRYLQPLTSLTHLDLTGRVSLVTDEDVACLEALTGLTSLCVPEMRRVSGEALRSIGRLTNLAFLNLELCMTSSGYGGLAGLTNLRALGLSTCAGLTESDLQMLCSGLSALEAIDLAFTRVGDCGCLSLSLCPSLTSISLESCPITDAGLIALQALPRLTTLNLQTCAFVPLGIAALRPMPCLRTVGLCKLQSWATQLELERHPDDGRGDAVEAMLPSCVVEREPMGYSINDFFTPEQGVKVLLPADFQPCSLA